MWLLVFPDLGTTCQLIFAFVSLRSNVGVEMMAKFNAISVSKCNCKSPLCVTDGWGFPGGSAVESTCQCGTHGFNPRARKIPCSRKRQPTPVFLPGEFHEQRNLVCYSPWGRKETDTTVWLSTLTLSTHPIHRVFPSSELVHRYQSYVTLLIRLVCGGPRHQLPKWMNDWNPKPDS